MEGGNINSAIENRPIQPIYVLTRQRRGQMKLGSGLLFDSSRDLQQIIELL